MAEDGEGKGRELDDLGRAVPARLEQLLLREKSSSSLLRICHEGKKSKELGGQEGTENS